MIELNHSLLWPHQAPEVALAQAAAHLGKSVLGNGSTLKVGSGYSGWPWFDYNKTKFKNTLTYLKIIVSEL